MEKNRGVRPGIPYYVRDAGVDVGAGGRCVNVISTLLNVPILPHHVLKLFLCVLDFYEDWRRVNCDSLTVKRPEEQCRTLTPCGQKCLCPFYAKTAPPASVVQTTLNT